MQNKKPILVKDDKQDGWIYVCPYCHEYLCKTGKCPKCGNEADWKMSERYTGKVYYRMSKWVK